VGRGVVGGASRKINGGVIAKRQFPLLSTKIKFSPRAQTQNIRMCSLYDLDVVDRFAISSK
jgi:hypothetical protein